MRVPIQRHLRARMPQLTLRHHHRRTRRNQNRRSRMPKIMRTNLRKIRILSHTPIHRRAPPRPTRRSRHRTLTIPRPYQRAGQLALQVGLHSLEDMRGYRNGAGLTSLRVPGDGLGDKCTPPSGIDVAHGQCCRLTPPCASESEKKDQGAIALCCGSKRHHLLSSESGGLASGF